MNYRKVFTLLLLVGFTFQLHAQRPSRYNLRVGDQFKVTASVEQDITQTMFGQKVETEQNITTIDLYEVISVSDEGYLMKTTGLSRNLKMSSAQGEVSIDSDLGGDEHLAFRALTNKSYYVEMNWYGRFLRFQGIDEMKEEIRKELLGTLLEENTDDLMAGIEEETLSNAFNGQFYIYPEPGKSLDREATMVVNNLPVTIAYNFSWVDDGTISATGDMSLSGDFEVMGQQMTAAMEGIQTSLFKIDAETGLAMTIETEQDLDGSLEFQDISIPMTIKTMVEVTVSK